MTKEQALYTFWSSFGLPAYDENTVPDNAKLPYITYNVVDDKLDRPVLLQGSLWYRGTKWTDVTAKKNEIAQFLEGFVTYKLDNGWVWVVQGSPFAQRMSDPNDDQIRRMYINIQAEYLTNY